MTCIKATPPLSTYTEGMVFLLLLPTILCDLLLAAHWLRYGSLPPVVVCAALPLLLLLRRHWVAVAMQVLLLLGAAEWTRTLLRIASERMEQGEPWVRSTLILSAVAAFNLLALLPYRTKTLRCRCRQ